MPPPELLVMRHGETEWNREGRFQGALDSPLTDRGRSQAVALGDLLRGLGAGPDSHDILTSPQGRARETASLALGVAARPEPRLREIAMGAWTGLTRAEVDAGWPPHPGEGILGLYGRCPDGEGLEAVASRVEALLAGLRRPAILVTHGLTLRLLCARAIGWPAEGGERVVVPQGALARVRAGRIEVLEPGLPENGAEARTNAAGG